MHGLGAQNGAASGAQLRKSGGPELTKSGGTQLTKSGGSDQRKFCMGPCASRIRPGKCRLLYMAFRRAAFFYWRSVLLDPGTDALLIALNGVPCGLLG